MERLTKKARLAAIAREAGGNAFPPQQAVALPALLDPNQGALVLYEPPEPPEVVDAAADAADPAGLRSETAVALVRLRAAQRLERHQRLEQRRQSEEQYKAWIKSEDNSSKVFRSMPSFKDESVLATPWPRLSPIVPAPGPNFTFERVVCAANVHGMMTSLKDNFVKSSRGFAKSMDPDKAQTLKMSEDFWNQTHKFVCTVHVPGLGHVPTYTVTQCSLAGYCLHGRAHNPCRSLVSAWRTGLMKLLTKGSSTRNLYEGGTLHTVIFRQPSTVGGVQAPCR